MSELCFFSILLSSWYGLSLIVFITLQFLSAPYGRHIRSGWGPVIPSVWGWVFMELPAVIVPIVCCVISERITQSFSLFCLALWQIHYIHRTFIYPFRMRLQGKRMPLLIAITAWVTNLGINYLIFRDLFTFGEQKTGSWWLETHVIIGVLLFASGFYVNRSSDATLRKLRRPGELGYHIPNGGMYRWVSCPNYLGGFCQN